MNILQQVRWLIWKEFTVELNQKFSFSGLIVYVLSNVYICYLVFSDSLSVPVWNALFWILNSFIALNAVARSFLVDSQGALLFQYTLHHPLAVIISKILYNLALMLTLSLSIFLLFNLLLGSKVQSPGLFVVCIVLGNLGFSCVFSLAAALTARAGSSTVLLTVLALPLLFPVLMITVMLSKNSMDGVAASVFLKNILTLGALDLITFVLALILFPFLWKE
ncbi:MAG: heme exporter protein CcmB [Bacteroidetes bacterium]|nr:heme exporter protein CcmB [Bacteroidota bacterium]